MHISSSQIDNNLIRTPKSIHWKKIYAEDCKQQFSGRQFDRFFVSIVSFLSAIIFMATIARNDKKHVEYLLFAFEQPYMQLIRHETHANHLVCLYFPKTPHAGVSRKM